MPNITIKLNKEVARTDYVDIDFPEIRIASTGQIHDVIEMSGVRNANSFTLTVRPRKTEDAECEVVEQKKIEKINLEIPQ